jgi:hypothetical protein
MAQMLVAHGRSLSAPDSQVGCCDAAHSPQLTDDPAQYAPDWGRQDLGCKGGT